MNRKNIVITKSDYNKIKDTNTILKFRDRYSFSDRYEILEEIADSSHGNVYVVVKYDIKGKKSNGIKSVAVPYRYTESLNTIGYKGDFIKIDLLSRIEHPNILKITDIVYNKRKNVIYTISNMYTNKLSEYVKTHDIDDRIRIAHEVISSIKFLYDNGVVLLDLDIDMYNMLYVNPNTTNLTKIKNIIRSDVPITYNEVRERTKNSRLNPPEISQIDNKDISSLFDYKHKDENVNNTSRLQYTMFMMGIILYNIFYPTESSKLKTVDDLYNLLDAMKNQNNIFADNISPDLKNLLKYSLHYDPSRRHSSFDAILELPIFSKYVEFNLGTNYVLPALQNDAFPKECFQEYCIKIEEFALEHKISTFILGNSYALYMKLCSNHLYDKLPYESYKKLCQDKSCYALSISTLISTEMVVPLPDIFKYFYPEYIDDNDKYSLFLTELYYHICFTRGITMESTYIYSPNYQIFYKSLLYYNKGNTSLFLMANSSPDNFVSNLIKNHIVTVPEPKYKIFDALSAPENIYAPTKYIVNAKIKEIEYANENKDESVDAHDENEISKDKVTRTKPKTLPANKSRRSRQRK